MLPSVNLMVIADISDKTLICTSPLTAEKYRFQLLFERTACDYLMYINKILLIFDLEKKDRKPMQKKLLVISLISLMVSGCLSDPETPRDVADISSSDTTTIFNPKIVNSSKEGLEIKYAQLSFGFDAGCNPYKSFSSDLNECAKLPENVKNMAMVHCSENGKTAVFLGNKTSLLQITISKFSCEET